MSKIKEPQSPLGRNSYDQPQSPDAPTHWRIPQAKSLHPGRSTLPTPPPSRGSSPSRNAQFVTHTKPLMNFSYPQRFRPIGIKIEVQGERQLAPMGRMRNGQPVARKPVPSPSQDNRAQLAPSTGHGKAPRNTLLSDTKERQLAPMGWMRNGQPVARKPVPSPSQDNKAQPASSADPGKDLKDILPADARELTREELLKILQKNGERNSDLNATWNGPKRYDDVKHLIPKEKSFFSRLKPSRSSWSAGTIRSKAHNALDKLSFFSRKSE